MTTFRVRIGTIRPKVEGILDDAFWALFVAHVRSRWETTL